MNKRPIPRHYQALFICSLVLVVTSCLFESQADKLISAVKAKDVTRVENLLASGADPLASASTGDTPLKAAFREVTEGKSRKEFRPSEIAYDDPRNIIVHKMMNVVRAKDHEFVDVTGRTEHFIEMGRFNPDGINAMTSYYFVVPESGERVEFWHSIYDTEYVGIGPTGKNPEIPIGALVRLQGYRTEQGGVEATRIELLDGSATDRTWKTSASYYHESTFFRIVEQLYPEDLKQ